VALLLCGLTVDAAAIPFDDLLTTDDIGRNKIPHLGTSHILVIPSRVGVTEFPATRWAELQKRFASEATDGTFRRYWQIVSNGKYDPIPTLAKPVLFPDSCPIPGREVTDCQLAATPEGVLALLDGSAANGLKKVLERVRDEQGIALGQFDVNGATEGKADGYFDGVIIDSDIYNGIALPLAGLKTEISVPASSPTDTNLLKLGILAMVPPDYHEFTHCFGLIDLYGGPPVNDTLGDNENASISAFTRQQLGWSEVIKVTGKGSHVLTPTLDGGSVLRIGAWENGARYLMIENRGGKQHNVISDDGVAGIYIYSVDEGFLPITETGFLDLSNPKILYLPNKHAPYLNVNMPLYCSLRANGPKACSASSKGTVRKLTHASGQDDGLALQIDSVAADGKISISIIDAPPEPDAAVAPDLGPKDLRVERRHDGPATGSSSGCGCQTAAAPGVGWILCPLLALGLAIVLARRRSHR
jgi:MYXO-CTERM domain-containing protein